MRAPAFWATVESPRAFFGFIRDIPSPIVAAVFRIAAPRGPYASTMSESSAVGLGFFFGLGGS